MGKMMKLSETKLIIFIAAIILGYIFSSQLSYLKPAVIEIPSLQGYQQAMWEITKSRDEINMLKEKRKLLDSKLHDYENSGSLGSEVVKKLEAELKEADLYACLTDVTGPGVVISLSDNVDKAAAARTIEDMKMYNIHDLDIMELVWALRNAGAEAISVNDQRITHNSNFYCAGPVVIINRIKMVPPYIIKAIGNLEALVEALENDDKFLELRYMDFPLRLSKEDKIIIYKSNNY